MIQIYLDGVDISRHCIDIDELAYNVGEYGQLFTIDTYNITLDNIRGLFDSDSANSPFYNNELTNHKMAVYMNGSLITEGFISQCKPDSEKKTSVITLIPSNINKLDQSCIYASSEEATPSAIVSEICDLYKIPYDQLSFFGSSSVYELDNVYLSVFFENECSIREAIQQIAEFACARVYMYRNKLYFDVYRETSTSITPAYIFSDDSTIGIVNLWSTPRSENVNKQSLTGYKIEYIDGTAEYNTDGETNKSLNGDYGNPVRIMSLQSAVWIGEKWLEYLAKPQRRVKIRCASNIGNSLNLGYIVQITYNDKTEKYKVVGIKTNELYTELELESL